MLEVLGLSMKYFCWSSRGYSSPRRARPAGALLSSRVQCAMAARCPCFATASRIPSKPSSVLPATRTACSPAWAAASEEVKCLDPHPLLLLQERELDSTTGRETQDSSSKAIIEHKTGISNKNLCSLCHWTAEFPVVIFSSDLSEFGGTSFPSGEP